VARVDIQGTQPTLTRVIAAMIKTRAGAPFDSDIVGADLLAVQALDTFDDVRLFAENRPEGLVITLDVHERPTIRDVFLAAGSTVPDPGAWVAPLSGDLYVPASVSRAARILQRVWVAEGYLDARADVRAIRTDNNRVDICLDLRRGPAWKITQLEFPGAKLVPPDELRAQMTTKDGSVNTAGHPFRRDLLDRDLLVMTALYYDRGFLTVKVGLPRVTRLPGQALRVEIPVEEGLVYRVGRLAVTGQLAGPREGYEASLGVSPKQVFSRSHMLGAIERLKKHHRDRTGKDIDVVPSTDLSPEDATVDIEFRVGGSD
jgi:outer membrane protein insertion porin family